MKTSLIELWYNSDEYLRRLKARAASMTKCENELYRAQVIGDYWAVDPVRFIEDCLWIKIPEYRNSIKPFFLFDYQKKIIWDLVEAERSGEDVEILIDKLRGMGMTWLIAAYMFWRWMFTPNWSGFILSRTESEVDDGLSIPDNSIFGKIRFFVEHIPPWLVPEGFSPKGKKGTATDSTLRIINPAMGTSINGSSTNSSAGRSKRYSFVFFDECFFAEHFSEVWRSLQSVARVKIFVSSVKQGRVAESFKDMCKAAGHYISLSWKDHPWKDEEWFNEKLKLAEFDPEVMKEIIVDYSVNIRDQYYPEVRQAQVVPLEYFPQRPLYTFLDFGKQDLTVIGWAQFDGNWLDILECFAARQKPLEYYVPFLNPETREFSEDWYNDAQLQVLYRVRAWQKPKGNFGEAAHFQKVMPLNVSIAEMLYRRGVRLMKNDNAIRYEPRRHATSLLLPKTRFNQNSAGAMELYDALAQSRYANAPGASSKDATLKPKHDDEIADFRAAFENLCVNIPRVLRSQRSDIGDNFREDHFAAHIIKQLRI